MRDYAKKPNYNKSHSNFNGAWMLILLLFCAISFAGYESYHFVKQKWLAGKENVMPYVKAPSHPHVIKKPIEQKAVIKRIEHKNPVKKAARIKKVKKEIITLNPANIQPKYDFYKLLPEMTVSVPTKDQPAIPSPSSQSNHAL